MTTLQIGRIGRAHGIRGELYVILTTERTERLDPGERLETDRGSLEVVSSRPHGRGWLVRFAGVEDRADAESLAGTLLHAESDDDVEGLWVHQLVGLQIVDTNGDAHGRIVAIQANPAHDLLVLDDDTLVPAVFITSVDERVVVDPPEGLFE